MNTMRPISRTTFWVDAFFYMDSLSFRSLKSPLGSSVYSVQTQLTGNK
jgi:hypothetical protein